MAGLAAGFLKMAVPADPADLPAAVGRPGDRCVGSHLQPDQFPLFPGAFRNLAHRHLAGERGGLSAHEASLRGYAPWHEPVYQAVYQRYGAFFLFFPAGKDARLDGLRGGGHRRQLLLVSVHDPVQLSHLFSVPRLLYPAVSGTDLEAEGIAFSGRRLPGAECGGACAKHS